jgi:Calcineurin-like phosphoesterase
MKHKIKHHGATTMRSILSSTLKAASLALCALQAAQAGVVHFVYASDQHYGITRARFQGSANVPGNVVNRAMVDKMNTLTAFSLPADNGVGAGTTVGAVDWIWIGGDIANRQETGNQTDSLSWSQFKGTYLDSILLKGRDGNKSRFLLLPGNHDVSNAVGYYKTMVPATDPTSMVEIFNRMMNPATPKTNATYSYATDKINYSRDIAGIHVMCVNMWPDSANRIWMEDDLKSVSATTPVVVITHDQPDLEAKHLMNWHDTAVSINKIDKFENLLAEHMKDAKKTATDTPFIEMQGLADFLKLHTNIKAYFHGNSNKNEFYTWTGPAKDVSLPTFRVDSPMKGDLSATNQDTLSFQLISLDSASQTMTVRECLWNKDSLAATPIKIGQVKTMSLSQPQTTGIARHDGIGDLSIRQHGSVLSLTSSALASGASVRIMDLRGTVIATRRITTNQSNASMDLGTVGTGLYVVSLESAERTSRAMVNILR